MSSQAKSPCPILPSRIRPSLPPVGREVDAFVPVDGISAQFIFISADPQSYLARFPIRGGISHLNGRWCAEGYLGEEPPPKNAPQYPPPPQKRP